MKATFLLDDGSAKVMKSSNKRPEPKRSKSVCDKLRLTRCASYTISKARSSRLESDFNGII